MAILQIDGQAIRHPIKRKIGKLNLLFNQDIAITIVAHGDCHETRFRNLLQLPELMPTGLLVQGSGLMAGDQVEKLTTTVVTQISAAVSHQKLAEWSPSVRFGASETCKGLRRKILDAHAIYLLHESLGPVYLREKNL